MHCVLILLCNHTATHPFYHPTILPLNLWWACHLFPHPALSSISQPPSSPSCTWIFIPSPNVAPLSPENILLMRTAVLACFAQHLTLCHSSSVNLSFIPPLNIASLVSTQTCHSFPDQPPDRSVLHVPVLHSHQPLLH